MHGHVLLYEELMEYCSILLILCNQQLPLFENVECVTHVCQLKIHVSRIFVHCLNFLCRVFKEKIRLIPKPQINFQLKLSSEENLCLHQSFFSKCRRRLFFKVRLDFFRWIDGCNHLCFPFGYKRCDPGL